MEAWEGWTLAIVGWLAFSRLQSKLDERRAAKRTMRAFQKAAKTAAKAATSAQASRPAEPSPMQKALDQIAERDAQIAAMRTSHAAEITVLKAEHEVIVDALIIDQAEALKDLNGQLKAAQGAAQHWERAYRNLEEHPPARRSRATPEAEGKFKQLRALIVKELHPDHAEAGSVDRALRTEVFKALWPKIEAL